MKQWRHLVIGFLVATVLAFPFGAFAHVQPTLDSGAALLSEIRDKGEIPLARPDSKPAGAIDPQTGYLAVAFLDLSAHKAVVWWQKCGCYLPTQDYGNVNLVGWVGFAHDGHMKIIGRTWDENGGVVDGKHFVVVDLGVLP